MAEPENIVPPFIKSVPQDTEYLETPHDAKVRHQLKGNEDGSFSINLYSNL
jgi:hypothetical protein